MHSCFLRHRVTKGLVVPRKNGNLQLLASDLETVTLKRQMVGLLPATDTREATRLQDWWMTKRNLIAIVWWTPGCFCFPLQLWQEGTPQAVPRIDPAHPCFQMLLEAGMCTETSWALQMSLATQWLKVVPPEREESTGKTWLNSWHTTLWGLIKWW